MCDVSRYMESTKSSAREGEAAEPFASELLTRRRKNILLVEDNQLVASALTGVLQDRDYDVVCADSGEKAWELWMKKRRAVDLVLSDLQLPGISGKEILKRIRALSFSVPVLILSGDVPTEEAEELSLLGAAGLIAKPVHPRELIAAVDRILGVKTT